ncbi:MAG: 50S ribosomal protein L3 [Candidatus Marinimicrobia bacterium]|nr:50S ribosomal protein L3 [Candidatus Neomarinimicrobiota bacterium]|tara:strand:- start:301 stop:918 length:618 start_codon:yes stop_codon:yes gene_type:complete
MRGLLGKKVGMTRIFDSNGDVVPVTVLQAGPCIVTQIKTEKNDGYNAIQVGFGEVNDKHLSNPLKGHFKSANAKPSKYLAEFDVVPGFEYVSGSVFHVGIFKTGDYVRVSGYSKGRGFTGVIKRHNFSRQKKTHGTGHTERAPGSIGQASDPSRVFPGMRMAGRHGNAKVTIENLEIMEIDKRKNYLLVKGSVPGPKDSVVAIER